MLPTDGPFRASSLSCPRCKVELSKGDLARCSRCHGMWVGQEALHDRVAAMQSAKPALAYASCLRHEGGKREQIPCVACATPMETLLLFEVPIDRCQQHGVWFDHEELERVLFAARHHSQTAGTGPERAACTACEREYLEQAKQLKTSSESGAGGVVWGVLEVLGGILFDSISRTAA